MKIIFSPSKEMNKDTSLIFPMENDIVFPQKTSEILEVLKSLDSETLSKKLKINSELLRKTLNLYETFEENDFQSAIELYKGTAFKALELTNYTEEEREFMKNNLYILSAFYGILNTNTKVKPYRLDMTVKLLEGSLYKFWRNDVSLYIKKNTEAQEYILNLASGEYFKMLNLKKLERKVISVDFKELRNHKYVSVSSFSKQARGMMLNYIVKNAITNVEDIKAFKLAHYEFSEKLSDKENFIFTR